MPKRILITGGSGLLALNWACCMREEWDVHLALHRHKVSLRGARTVVLDLTSVESLQDALQALLPDAVLHTAGLADVDQCERDPQSAHDANAVLARNVATATARLGLRLVHISTDHLFAGTRSRYTEDDPAEPVNVYARTKLLGEQWVTQAHPRALVIRTNFFGWGHRFRHSSSDQIVHALRAGEALTMFEDVFFTPILADRLALAVHRLMAGNASGTFNVVGDERVSRHAFALRLAEAFELPKALIQRGRISHAGLAAPRPPDMSLDNTKARNALGVSLGTLDEFFSDLRRQQRLGRPAELFQAVSAD